MKMIEGKMNPSEIDDIYSEAAELDEVARAANDSLDMLESALDQLDGTLDLNDIKSARVKGKMRKIVNRL